MLSIYKTLPQRLLTNLQCQVTGHINTSCTSLFTLDLKKTVYKYTAANEREWKRDLNVIEITCLDYGCNVIIRTNHNNKNNQT